MIPLTYEDIMTVDKWDESKLIFQKVNLQGAEQYFLGNILNRNIEQQQTINDDQMNKGANQMLSISQN